MIPERWALLLCMLLVQPCQSFVAPYRTLILQQTNVQLYAKKQKASRADSDAEVIDGNAQPSSDYPSSILASNRVDALLDWANRHLEKKRDVTSTEGPCASDGLKLITDVDAFDIAIQECALNKDPHKALELLSMMDLLEVTPNMETLGSVLYSCCTSASFVLPQILELLATMETKYGFTPSYAHFERIFSVCAMQNEWLKIAELFKVMEDRGLMPGHRALNTAINAYGYSRNWEKVLDLLETMENRGLQPNFKAYTAAIEACLKYRIRKFDKAPELLKSMQSLGFRPSIRTFGRVIHAYGYAGQWEKALELFESMEHRGVRPDVNTLTSVIRICGYGGKWEKALELFESMKGRGLHPTLITFNCAIGACCASGKWKQATELLESMDVRGLLPDNTTLGTVIKVCGQDALLRHEAHGFVEALGLRNPELAQGLEKRGQGRCKKVIDSPAAPPGGRSGGWLWPFKRWFGVDENEPS